MDTAVYMSFIVNLLHLQNPSQKLVQKLSAEAWNRLPQSVKGMNVEWQEWEKYWSEPDIKELARGVLCQF